MTEVPPREDRPVLAAGAAPRAPVLTPLDVANIVARNLVPVAGVLFFSWSAASLLILYFADTLLAMTVMFAGLMHHALHMGEGTGAADRVNSWAGLLIGALFLSAVFAVPLGMPIAILVFGTADVSWRSILADNGFKVGLALQVAASIVAFRSLIGALSVHTPEQLRVKRRFAILFLRWFCVIALAMTPFVHFFGRFGPLLLVIAYAGLTIFTEVNPTRFLAMMGEKGENMPLAPRPPRAHAQRRSRRRQ